MLYRANKEKQKCKRQHLTYACHLVKCLLNRKRSRPSDEAFHLFEDVQDGQTLLILLWCTHELPVGLELFVILV